MANSGPGWEAIDEAWWLRNCETREQSMSTPPPPPVDDEDEDP